MVGHDSITINGKEITRDTTLNRLPNAYLPDLDGTDPYYLLKQVAEDIFKQDSIEVEENDVEELADNFYSNPDRLDDFSELSFLAMNVTQVLNSNNDKVKDEIHIRDFSAGGSHVVSPQTLEEHLGKTIFVAGGD